MRFNLLQEELTKEGKCLNVEVVYNKEIKRDYNSNTYITNWCNNACFVLPWKPFNSKLAISFRKTTAFKPLIDSQSDGPSIWFFLKYCIVLCFRMYSARTAEDTVWEGWIDHKVPFSLEQRQQEKAKSWQKIKWRAKPIFK